jgi:soluble lytic murein transglycosylase-like protein
VPRVKKESARRQSSYKSLSKRQIDRLADLFGKRHKVDASLVKAVIEVESDYNPKVVSSAGAQGLMQIMPETQKDLGLDNPFDPVENVEAGVRYLRMMLDRFKDVRLALAAYNAGPLTVEKYGGIPPFAETRKYVTKVLKRYRYNRSKVRQNVQPSK